MYKDCQCTAVAKREGWVLKALLIPSGAFNRGRNRQTPAFRSVTKVLQAPETHARPQTLAIYERCTRLSSFISVLDFTPAGELAMKEISSGSPKMQHNCPLQGLSHAIASFSSLEASLPKLSHVLDCLEVGGHSTTFKLVRHVYL